MPKDKINPSHYKYLNGIEVIEVTEQFNFNKGNSLKYIMRSGHKNNEIEDLEKAKWYIEREIKRINNKKK